MDLHSFDFDQNMINIRPLLKIDGGLMTRIIYGKISKVAQGFYDDYEVWCKKHQVYIDFIPPLHMHLHCLGFAKWRIKSYMKKVENNIINYLNRTVKLETQTNSDD